MWWTKTSSYATIYPPNHHDSKKLLDSDDSAPESETESEWRLLVGARHSMVVAGRDSNSTFRKPDGTPVLPAETYFTIFKEVTEISKSYYWKLQVLGIVAYLCALLLPICVLDIVVADGYEADEDYHIPRWIVNLTLFVSFGTWFAIFHFVSTNVYRAMDAELDDYVAQKKGDLHSLYGVDMGYRRHEGYWRTMGETSCVWLKSKIRHEDEAETATLTTVADSSTARLDVTKTYPPIFIHRQVPGDVAITESKYHSSFVYDSHTWKLIQETHKTQTNNPLFRCLIFTVCILLMVVATLNPLLIAALSFMVTMSILFGLFAVVAFLAWCIDIWLLKRYHEVAESVTTTLNERHREQHESETSTEAPPQFVLTMETNPLPFRHGCACKRYELKKVPSKSDVNSVV